MLGGVWSSGDSNVDVTRLPVAAQRSVLTPHTFVSSIGSEVLSVFSSPSTAMSPLPPWLHRNRHVHPNIDLSIDDRRFIIRMDKQPSHHTLFGRPCRTLNDNPPPHPNLPRHAPTKDRKQYTRCTAPRPRPKAQVPMAVSFSGASVSVACARVCSAVYDAPHGRSSCWHHRHDTPVCGEVFDAPDYGDDDGDKGKACAVAEANECGRQVE